MESLAALSGVAMIGLAQWLWDEFTISGQTLSRELRALGYRKLSARPRHHAQDAEAIPAFERLLRQAGGEALELGIEVSASDQEAIALSTPTLMVRRGTDVKLTILFDALASSARRDPKLVELIVKAHQAKRQLGLDGKPPTVDPDLDYHARNHLARLARFAFLSPEITTAILEGSQPTGLSVRKLIRTADLPMDWKQQKHLLGFG